MFENEAEEYIKKDGTETEKLLNSVKLSLTREEATVLIKAIKQGFKDGTEFGYKKANEWHYVKDGKYPKEKQLVMVYRVNPLGANIAITNWYDSYKDTKVIAWKEIVFPELPKESE